MDANEPIYYSNRSMSYLKKELFGLALEDANTALKLNPSFIKAYFRRATANLALGKYKVGRRGDFGISALVFWLGPYVRQVRYLKFDLFVFCNPSNFNRHPEYYTFLLPSPTYDRNWHSCPITNLTNSLRISTNFQIALSDYNRVRTARPNDQDVQRKYDEVQKIVKRNAFLQAIAVDDPKSIAESIDLNSFEVESSYKGPRLDEDITLEFMLELIHFFKKQGKLHVKYAYKVITRNPLVFRIHRF